MHVLLLPTAIAARLEANVPSIKAGNRTSVLRSNTRRSVHVDEFQRLNAAHQQLLPHERPPAAAPQQQQGPGQFEGPGGMPFDMGMGVPGGGHMGGVHMGMQSPMGVPSPMGGAHMGVPSPMGGPMGGTGGLPMPSMGMPGMPGMAGGMMPMVSMGAPAPSSAFNPTMHMGQGMMGGGPASGFPGPPAAAQNGPGRTMTPGGSMGGQGRPAGAFMPGYVPQAQRQGNARPPLPQAPQQQQGHGQVQQSPQQQEQQASKRAMRRFGSNVARMTQPDDAGPSPHQQQQQLHHRGPGSPGGSDLLANLHDDDADDAATGTARGGDAAPLISLRQMAEEVLSPSYHGLPEPSQRMQQAQQQQRQQQRGQQQQKRQQQQQRGQHTARAGASGSQPASFLGGAVASRAGADGAPEEGEEDVYANLYTPSEAGAGR